MASLLVLGAVGVSALAWAGHQRRLTEERRQRARERLNAYRVFVIAGAAGGLGHHLTRMLLAREATGRDTYDDAEAGKTVVAVDVYEVGLRAYAESEWKGHGDRLKLRPMDIRRLREWQTLFAELETTVGHVDVLLNVAGYVRSGPALEMDEVEVHRHLDINVKGVIFGSQVAAAHMSKEGSGHIVNMASLAGILSVPNYALFSAAKHAVRAYSRALGLELRGSGVAVTVMCPDRVWMPEQAPASKAEASTMFLHPPYLRPADVERALFDVVLLDRPRELGLPWFGALQAWILELLPDAVVDRALLWRFDRGVPSAAHDVGPTHAYLDSRRLSESHGTVTVTV